MASPALLLKHPEALCNMVRRVVYEAGEMLLDYAEMHDVAATVTYKEDGSPVTPADRMAEEIIVKGLQDILPDVPVIAEEAASLGQVPDITDAPYFWLVDPLDGTRAYVAGNGDFTVNVALIHDGAPVLGVIGVPAREEVYSGCGPDTAQRWHVESDTEKSLRVRRVPAAGMIVAASSSADGADKARLEAFLELHKVAKLVRHSSAYKFCLLAAGKADMYPRFGPTYEWDTAAGDALLRAAGAEAMAGVFDLSGAPLRYGRTDQKYLNPDFVAGVRDYLLVDDNA